MIRDAIEKIESLCELKTIEIDGEKFANKKLFKIEHDNEPPPSVLIVHTLSGLVDYCRAEIDNSNEYTIHILHSDHIKVYGEYEAKYGRRKHYLSSTVKDFDFDFGHYYDQELFIINLLTQFEDNQARKDVMKIVSNITTESKSDYVDDGMSQKVVVKESMARVAEVNIPNPVSLIPKRSFPEIEHVECPFVLRMKRTGTGPHFALYEAGFAQWEVQTIQIIKKYLQENLPKDSIIIA